MSEHLCKNNTCTEAVGAQPGEKLACPTSSPQLSSFQTDFFLSFVTICVAKSVTPPPPHICADRSVFLEFSGVYKTNISDLPKYVLFVK